MNNKPKTAHNGTESVNKSINPKNQKAMKKLKKAGIKDICNQQIFMQHF